MYKVDIKWIFILNFKWIGEKKTTLQKEPHQHSNRQRTTHQLETQGLALRSIAGEWYSRVGAVDAGTAICECVGSG